jgi:hypothetical protein
VPRWPSPRSPVPPRPPPRSPPRRPRRSLPPTPGPPPAGANRALGVDSANFDRAVRPQDDFFRFVNGGWLARTQIPADRSRWGAFDELRERSSVALRTILEEAARSTAPAGSIERKIGDMYASYLDSAAVDRRGLAPLQGELRAIAAVANARQLPGAWARLARLGVATPVGVYVSQDQRNSSSTSSASRRAGSGSRPRLLPEARRQARRGAHGLRAVHHAPPHARRPARRRRRGRARGGVRDRSSPASSGTARATATATPPTTG